MHRRSVLKLALSADGSRLLVGNSSAGIIEAATFGCTVLNIGDRQAGREQSQNVLNVPWSAKALDAALTRARTDKALAKKVALRRNVYGDGHAADRIQKILESPKTWPIPTIKSFHDAKH